MTLDALSAVGAVTGTLSLGVSFLVYLRDAPRVRVAITFDMTGLETAQGQTFCVIDVVNAGRRAIYLSHLHLPKLTKGGSIWVFCETLQPIMLAEGAAPFSFKLQQETLRAGILPQNWWRIRAQATDAAGRTYRSRWPTTKPSFATCEAPPLAMPIARFLNALADFRMKLLA